MANNLLGLSREQLKKFLPDHQSIRAFEQLLLQVGDVTPTSIEQANNNAATAIAMAGAALSSLTEAISELEQVLTAPAPEQTYEAEDYSQVTYVGTLGVQNDDEVEITGGTINGTSIGTTTASTGAFTGLSYSLQLTSTVATGTAPMVVSSTTKVNNLNVDLLDGKDWASPDPIGTVAPQDGTFNILRGNSLAKVICDSPTSQSVATATFTTITNWTERLDVGNNFNATTGIFTAPRTGIYLISARIAFGNIVFTAVNQLAANAIFKNGVQAGAGHLISQAAVTISGTIEPVVIAVSLAASDTISVRVFQNSGSNASTQATNDSYLSIIELP